MSNEQSSSRGPWHGADGHPHDNMTLPSSGQSEKVEIVSAKVAPYLRTDVRVASEISRHVRPVVHRSHDVCAPGRCSNANGTSRRLPMTNDDGVASRSTHNNNNRYYPLANDAVSQSTSIWTAKINYDNNSITILMITRYCSISSEYACVPWNG